MSRYDRTKARQSGRYSPKSNKIKEGMPYLSALFLILIAAVGGFFAGRYLLEEKSKPNTEIQSLVIPDQSPNMNVQPMLTESEPLENLPSLTHQPTLPNLDSSDEFARDIILQSAPGLAQWLQNGQIIKSYLQIINDFSQGLRLVKHMDFLKPDAPFAVESHQDHTVIAEQSYQRYNIHLGTFTVINSARSLSISQSHYNYCLWCTRYLIGPLLSIIDFTSMTCI